MIYRIMLVIILAMVGIVLVLDYVGFHGTIILDKIIGESLITYIDNFFMLFQGPQGTTNFLYMTIFGACVSVGLIAIVYKFLKD